VRVTNEPSSRTGGLFSELLRLQTEFQARLADETLRYLRRLQGAAAPMSPGTVVLPDSTAELTATSAPGSTAELRVEVENLQRVHCMVTPMLSPLVSISGATWFPAVEADPATALLAPEEVGTLTFRLPLPENLPCDIYKGVLCLQGFRESGIPVTVTVAMSGRLAKTQEEKRRRPRKASTPKTRKRA
jgi:hypothetical protein